MPRFTDTRTGAVIETADPRTITQLRTRPGIKEHKARTAKVQEADTQTANKPEQGATAGSSKKS